MPTDSAFNSGSGNLIFFSKIRSCYRDQQQNSKNWAKIFLKCSLPPKFAKVENARTSFFIIISWPEIVLVMMMMMNCFCGMDDRRKAFSLISSRDNCQRSSPRISDTLRAGFEPAQNLSSGLVECSCAIMTTTTPRSHDKLVKCKNVKIGKMSNFECDAWTCDLALFPTENSPNSTKSNCISSKKGREDRTLVLTSFDSSMVKAFLELYFFSISAIFRG